MPRTAVTLGKTHKGEWEMLAHPDVPLLEQLKAFRQGLALKAHAKYCLIRFQESDGGVREQRLRTPKEQKSKEQQHAEELVKIKADTEAAAKAAQAQQSPAQPKPEGEQKGAAADSQEGAGGTEQPPA